MVLVPVAYALWQDFMCYDPDEPFLAGPRSLRALLWPCVDALLFDPASHRREAVRSAKCIPPGELACLTRSQIKHFRQLHSRCPGHPGRSRPPAWKRPRVRWDKAAATAGMAIAHVAARPIQSSRASISSTTTFSPFCSDGDMMEGISNEAASLAGHPQLGNLCWVYHRQ